MDVTSNVDTRTVNTLSICSGGGGLDLGLSLALPTARTVCYVEREAFAIEVLASAMDAGWLDNAPVWSDLRTFRGAEWRGVVDMLIGGIPCQPHSVAGQQRGEDDERDLWPDAARIIQDVQPAVVFLENVPGIMGYFHERIGRDLRRMGYSTETGLFSAAEVGASHQRQRFFILAHRESAGAGNDTRGLRGWARRVGEDVAHTPGTGTWHHHGEVDGGTGPSDVRPGNGATGSVQHNSRSSDVADTKGNGRRGRGNETAQQTEGRCGDVADADATRPQGRDIGRHGEGERAARTSSPPLFAPFRNDYDGWTRLLSEMPDVEPAFCRVAHGVASGLDLNENRIDRLRLLGNGVVPLTAAVAFHTLSRRAGL